ncbi:MAG: acetyl-CoA carboxylase biotin carboxyl carrier protein [Candidatus Firestonebacteria bacterium]
MNIKEIKDLIELLKGNDIAEIEIEREGMKIKLKKGSSNTIITPSQYIPPQASGSTTPQIETPKVQNQASEVKEEKTITIESPMVGTFYRTSSPDAQPFVKEGDEIKEGQTVCIIEAMKLMNEIRAEIKGKIIKVLVENGQPVEFGQPLFLVEPS